MLWNTAKLEVLQSKEITITTDHQEEVIDWVLDNSSDTYKGDYYIGYLTTDLTYEAVARKFEITNFTLLASWVNHFKIYGEVPISKKRGRRKKLESIASSMTQNSNDSQRIKELEQELRYAQIEVAYLKGLRRLEKNALMNKNQDSSTVSVKPSNSKKS